MRLRILALAALLAIGACGNAGKGDNHPTIVASTSILGDIVSNIVGSDFEVVVLMPIGVDPHDFQPSAAQAAAIADADIVVANGGGLEEGLEDVLDSAAEDGVTVIEVLGAANPLARADHSDEHQEDDHADEDHSDSDDHGDLDPHFWLDPARVALVVEFLAEEIGLSGTQRVETYLKLLAETEAASLRLFDGIDPNTRPVVTNHDALAYLANHLNLQIVGVVIPGGSTLGDPSSQELAELVSTIEAYGVTAIFTDSAASSVLAEAVAGEVGHTVEIVELYTDSLGGPGSGAETLVDMILLDARLIADSLRR